MNKMDQSRPQGVYIPVRKTKKLLRERYSENSSQILKYENISIANNSICYDGGLVTLGNT